MLFLKKSFNKRNEVYLPKTIVQGQLQKNCMKQFSKSFAMVALAAAAVLMGCGSHSDKKADGNGEPALPKILSFKVETNFNVIEYAKGVYRLSYDEKGRLAGFDTKGLEEVYSYSDDGNCRVVTSYRSDKSVSQTADFKCDDRGKPVEEHFVLVNSHMISGEAKGTILYSYDEEGRITCQDCKTQSPADGIIFKSDFKYDSSTGLLSEVNLRQKFPGLEVSDKLFRLEYSDRDNPVAFYPEYMLWFVFDTGMGANGQSGYWRNKLLDKMWILTPEGEKTAAVIFTYDFSEEGKLTGIHQSYREVTADGSLQTERMYFKITEIAY